MLLILNFLHSLHHDVARLVDDLEVFAHVEQVAGDESLQLCLEVR